MNEQTIRRRLTNKGYDPTETEDAVDRWADEKNRDVAERQHEANEERQHDQLHREPKPSAV